MPIQMNVQAEPVYEFKADPRKLCAKCKAEMHFCSDERYSARSVNGKVMKGCMARSNGSHPATGDWFLCLWCDTKDQASL